MSTRRGPRCACRTAREPVAAYAGAATVALVIHSLLAAPPARAEDGAPAGAAAVAAAGHEAASVSAGRTVLVVCKRELAPLGARVVAELGATGLSAEVVLLAGDPPAGAPLGALVGGAGARLAVRLIAGGRVVEVWRVDPAGASTILETLFIAPADDAGGTLALRSAEVVAAIARGAAADLFARDVEPTPPRAAPAALGVRDPYAGDDDEVPGEPPAPPVAAEARPGRLFTVFVGAGTGFGLLTRGGFSQINGNQIASGLIWAPLHFQLEPAIHLPLRSRLGLAIGLALRLQLSPVASWLFGVRGHALFHTGRTVTLELTLGVALGPSCKTPVSMVRASCRGGVTYLIPTPTSPANPRDYVLAGPWLAGAGFGLLWEPSPFVGLFSRLDAGALIGAAGFGPSGDPNPFRAQPYFELTFGAMFGM